MVNKMLIKIFMSRRNTKIYFIVVFLISLLFVVIRCLNSYYIHKNNENFNDSYIFTSNVTVIDKYIKKAGISKIIKVKKNTEGDSNLYYKIENSIFENKLLVSNNSYKYLKSSENFNDIEIDICSNCSDNLIYLNQLLFDKLNISNIDGYYITLSDWSEIDSIVKSVKRDKLSIELRYSEAYNANVLGITKLLKKLLFLIKSLIIILFFIIFIDIIIDSRSKCNLLNILGLTSNRIIGLTIIQFFIYILEFLIASSLSKFFIS